MSASDQAPVFDPSAPHQQRPRLRAIRGFGAKHGDMDLLGLSDARQISDQVVLVAPGFQAVLPHMDGGKTVDEIVAAVGQGLTREVLEQFIARMDNAGLLEGPTFQRMLDQMRRDFDATTHLPPGGTANFTDVLVQQEFGQDATEQQKAEQGPIKLRAAFDHWMKQVLDPAPDPSFDALPRAIFVPHLDYWRGWMNYAHSYGRMRVVDRPDRVIILGTNHFGLGTGVVGCDKGYETPLGKVDLDTNFVDTLKSKLGRENADKLFADRFDHEREHSIELQIPWIQHIFGPNESGAYPKVFGALIHDPLANSGQSYDGNKLALDPFVAALGESINSVGGRTLIVASVDLSHIGPSFGDQIALLGEEEKTVQLRERVLNHDRDMLNLLGAGKLEEMLTGMMWQQNPTRWCSLGAIAATMRLTKAEQVKMLSYTAAVDPQGMAMVSSFAGAIM